MPRLQGTVFSPSSTLGGAKARPVAPHLGLSGAVRPGARPNRSLVTRLRVSAVNTRRCAEEATGTHLSDTLVEFEYTRVRHLREKGNAYPDREDFVAP